MLLDYKKKKLSPRAVTPLSPPRDEFFSKEIVALGLPIRAHASVSDAALVTAADRLSRMLRYLPPAVHDRLVKRGASFHVIGVGQGTSDLPEHRHMKGVDGGYTGEKGVTLDQRARGMGGVQSSCGEENLIDLDSDPRYAGCDILTHEFAHCVMDVGLPRSLQDEIRATHRKAVEEEGRWKRADGNGLAYAGSNASEYFAELTMWYFGTHGEFVDRQKKLPTPGPGGLASYDPDGFKLLAAIYGGTHPDLASADPPARRLAPLDAADGSTAKSVNDDEEESNLVNVEFDNRGCGCAWKLYWLNPNGERLSYGEVRADSTYVQGTFAGHVWQLEASAGEHAAETRQLRYAASNDKQCIATVKEDARCTRVEAALPAAAAAA